MIVKSESLELTRAIEAVKRAARESDMGVAMTDLAEAVRIMSELRYQARQGRHANPAWQGHHGTSGTEDYALSETVMWDNVLVDVYAIRRLATKRQKGGLKEVIGALNRIERAAKIMKSQARRGVHRNPMSRRASRFIGSKIERLAHEGMEAPQRIAAAYSMARRRGFRVPRRPNPTLAVLNPPIGLTATWGKIEYPRPDDPAGKKIIREHEFPDGFIAEAMDDGSVVLRHPAGSKLWTVRRA